MSIVKRVQQWATFARTWHVYDCTWQNPFESALLIKTHLMGLHKPIYHPMTNTRSVSTHRRILQQPFASSSSLIYAQQQRNMGRLSKVDPSSYSEPERIVTKHSAFKWTVDFTNTKLLGSVTHKFNVLEANLPAILLDVRDISIKNASILCSGGSAIPINYFISDPVDDIGAKLTLELPEGTAKGDLLVRIDYETSNRASGLQWLTPEQTLGKQHPYLFSQCQAIHARSVLPCQDTPAVKFTYEATVEHPKELTALMSALVEKKETGVTKFKQEVPIPAYLLAIAIGDLVSRPLGPQSNVWAEAGIVEAAAEEFSETDKMLKTASDICGPYVWKQYDLLVMPPSFPFGGMENPCLTFVTPTVLAGDKSLADVVAHEIAHSWTGNLVTNKNFEHFWLNEGFTVFVETKIVGRLQGDKERDFHMLRNLTELRECIRTQLANNPELTKLVVDLSNCGPDDAFSSVPYNKGSTFLRYIEDLLGGPEVFEPFLRSYLQKYAYKSVVTDDFKSALYDYFNNTDKKDKLTEIDWDLWLSHEGMPPIIPKFDETLAAVSEQLAKLWSTKSTTELRADSDITKPISSHQLIDFLGKLIESSEIVDLNAEKIEFLENTYKLKDTKNSEVRFRFLRLVIRARLLKRIDEIIAFANSNFRMKFCRPIYRDLGQWPEAKPIAIKSFESVKNQMMAVCAHTIEKDLGLK
ncbi:leukotriene A-4 hydrolase isoform X1 [Bactrocera neohumeralis]|uniref:leukotriene A-4 hydrolase isoform X1 n=2 Tax=Bactrocera neohumeralis TaxID=98809 RepID=UPI002164FD94|nr:leukotriene A-4 hydrolase isoform X1 [Bactrocera neohumeralis]